MARPHSHVMPRCFEHGRVEPRDVDGRNSAGGSHHDGPEQEPVVRVQQLGGDVLWNSGLLVVVVAADLGSTGCSTAI